tara:strand:- start:956 stop:1177 length:222 start_codon:yes stop_codon:yes gene_type:complete
MKIKGKELRKLSNKELDNKLLEMRKNLLKVNAKIATGTTPENPSMVRNLKKTIARIHTIKTEKQKKEDPVKKK